MERKVFITAKIRDRLFDLIRTGRKRYEVRDASFEDARMIVYISAEDRSLLGIYELGESMALDRGDDTETIRLSGVSEKDSPSRQRRGIETLGRAHRRSDQRGTAIRG